MDNEIVVAISPAGQVTGMHRDEFNLGFLGPQRITRASDIRFDEEKQAWRIWLPIAQTEQEILLGLEIDFTRAESVGEFPTYNCARDFEVKWMNECLKEGVSPLSDKGAWIGSTLYHLFRV